MLELLKKHLAAFSAGNWDELKATVANDVTYEEAAAQQRANGIDEYIKIVQRWKRAYPDLTATVVGGFEAGDNAVVEIAWEGTHAGPLEGPFGTIQPTNKHGRVNAVELVKVKDGKLVELHHYFDMLTVLMQIGVVPMAGAGAPAAAKPAEAQPTSH